MITRYDFMTTQQQENGVVYPECLSFPLEKFIRKEPEEQVVIRQENYFRPDLLFADKRGTNSMEDVVLWLNQVSSRRELFPGLKINIPSAGDLNQFFIKNRI